MNCEIVVHETIPCLCIGEMTEEVLLVCLGPCGVTCCVTFPGTHGRQGSSSNARPSLRGKMLWMFVVVLVAVSSSPTDFPACLVLQLLTLDVPSPCDGANVKIGVPENYDGIFPWYLAKVSHFTLPGTVH